jgi:hypothetical protein
VDDDGRLTREGDAAREDIEVGTDEAADRAWIHVGRRKAEDVLAAMGPISQLIVERGGLPFPNPIGLPPPGV